MEPQQYGAAQVDRVVVHEAGAAQKSGSGADGTQDDDFPPTITIEENLYSDFVMCIARRRPGAIASSCLVLTLCMAIELTFAFVVVPLTIGDDISDYTEVDGVGNFIELWKSSSQAGGAQRMFLSNMTLVQWACSGSSFTWIGEKVNDMESYADGKNIYQGVVFGTLCMFIWAATIMKDLRGAINFSSLVLLPATSPSRPDYQYNQEEDTGRLVSLSRPAKLAVLFCVALRLVIDVGLGVNGAHFLANTQSLTDFILNSLALAFVFDLDELLFVAFLSSPRQKVVQSLEEPEVPDGLERRLILRLRPFTEIGCLIIIIMILIPVLLNYLLPFASDYVDEVFNVICPKGRGSGGANPGDYKE